MAHPVDRARDEWLKKGKLGKAHSKSDDSRKAIKAARAQGKNPSPSKVVEHKDGNPENNSPSNLRVISRGAHNSIHKKGKPIAAQAKGVKNKPNKPEKQRRFR